MSCDIKICTNHTGKMKGIKSISTSVLLNEHCQANRAIVGSICSHCYANNLAKMYKALQRNLEHNTKLLTTEVLPLSDLPKLDGEKIFRLESFGDLNNMIQLRNYYNIVRSNPSVKFSLYTKRVSLVREFFEAEDVWLPSNLTLVFSSLFLNRPLDITTVKLPTPHFTGQYKIFTVYTKDYILKHPELKINCGARSCDKCRLCYTQNEVQFISEILKTDVEGVSFTLDMRDEVKRTKILENMEKVIHKYR